MKRQVRKLWVWPLILLSVLFVPLLLAAPASAQTVTVLAPNGAENWDAGSSHAITWTTGGDAGATVDILLYKAGLLDRTIQAAAPNSGSFVWAVPSTLAPGQDYTIEVASVSVPIAADLSDAPFSVAPAVNRVITSPMGGEVWRCGETQAITWGGIPGSTVKIELYHERALDSVIAEGVPNVGSFSWTIPSSIVSGAEYQVKVSAGSSEFAISDNFFSILPAAFRVVSPNGGENWLAGSTHTITWTSGSVPGNVRIDLLKGGLLNAAITASTPNTGSYDWTIRNAQDAGTDYTVRVTSLVDAPAISESFGNFEIVAQQPCDIILSDDTAPIYAPLGTVVGTFTTLDRNPGDTFTYYMDCSVGADNQSFRISGNTLVTNEVFMTVGATKNISIISIDQSGLSVTRSFKIYIVGPDQLPTDISLNDNVIETLLPQGTRVGEFSTVDPNTADPNYGETFLYTLVGGAGSTDNGQFSIVGNQLQTATIFGGASTRSIRVRSTDRAGLFREEIFTVTISVNQPPVLDPIGDKAVNEGQNLSFTLSASDPNGGQLVYSASGMPSGATLTGTKFSWTPGNTQSGIYNVTFEVSDGVATDSETIQITVSDVNPTLFFEDFADGTSAGDTNWNKNAGTWTVPASSAMRYKATTATVTSLSTVKTSFLPKISSGRVEGLVRMVNLAPTQNAMLIFAFQGNGKYRYVQLVSGGEVRVGQVGEFGGVTAGIKARNAVSAAVATNYALRADTYADGRVKVYFKGGATPVLNYKFPSAVLGTVGVGVVSNGAEFDNFRVSDATVLPARVK